MNLSSVLQNQINILTNSGAGVNIGSMNTQAELKQGFTIDQIALILKVSRPTVYKYQKDGVLPVPTTAESLKVLIDARQDEVEQMYADLEYFSR